MADANVERDYSEFHRRVEAYVADVEAHLKLPADTVGSISSDNDFVFVLKMCGVIEPLIKEAVRATKVTISAKPQPPCWRATAVLKLCSAAQSSSQIESSSRLSWRMLTSSTVICFGSDGRLDLDDDALQINDCLSGLNALEFELTLCSRVSIARRFDVLCVANGCVEGFRVKPHGKK